MKLISRLCLVLLVIFTVFSGFITNFFRVGSYGAGTALIDLICLGLLLSSLIVNIKNYKEFRLNSFYISIFLSFFLLSAFKSLVDANSWEERALGFRNYTLYPSIFFAFTAFSRKSWTVLFYILSSVAFALCVFAVSQFIFRNVYPLSLLTLLDDPVLGFNSSDLIRVNGLIGNPIIFTGFVILFLTLFFIKFLFHKSFYNLIAFSSACTASILTFSRALWFFILLSIPLTYITVRKTSVRAVSKVILLVIPILILAVVYFVNNQNSFLVTRLLGSEKYTAGSNVVHIKQIRDALSLIEQHPIGGVGIGSQGTSSQNSPVVITDGWVFQIALELGLPLACVFFFLPLYPLLKAVKVFRNSRHPSYKTVSLTFIVLTFYFYSTCLVNSAYVSRVNSVLYWLLASMVLASFKMSVDSDVGGRNNGYSVRSSMGRRSWNRTLRNPDTKPVRLP